MLYGGYSKAYMSHSLNSLKGVIQGTIIGVIKGDTRSLDKGTHVYTTV